MWYDNISQKLNLTNEIYTTKLFLSKNRIWKMWPNNQVNGKAEPSWRQGSFLYFVRYPNAAYIRTECRKLAWFIPGTPSRSSFFLGWHLQTARKMGKHNSFIWTIFWVILLYMFFLNNNFIFLKHLDEYNYRRNIIEKMWLVFWNTK